MDTSKLISRIVFNLVSNTTRSFGGIRPRRLMHYVGDLAYQSDTPSTDEHQWYSDRYGLAFRLHPRYFIDRNIISFGIYDPRLHEFISREIKPGMVCFDVGAHIGTVSL